MVSELAFVSWNVGTLRSVLGFGKSRVPAPRLQAIVERLGSPDVLCLQEIGLRERDHGEISALREALADYHCRYALANDEENAKHRGGRAYGVVTYIRRSLAVSELPVPSFDREGRVLALALPSQRLVVCNVYAVNGTNKPYFDHALGRFEGDRHAFKRRFMAELLSYLRALRDSEWSLVLLGDWNISRSAIDTYPRLRTETPHAVARGCLTRLSCLHSTSSMCFAHFTLASEPTPGSTVRRRRAD